MDGCEERHYAKDFCEPHYKLWHHHGTLQHKSRRFGVRYEGAARKRMERVQFWMDHPLLTVDEVAAHFGITGSALRSQIQREDSDGTLWRARSQKAKEIQAEALQQKRLSEAKPCLVCGEMVYSASRKTCSPECADLWRKGRLRLSPEEHRKHRLAVARTILARPEKYKDVHIKWAKRFLEEEQPPTRRYGLDGSKASKAVERALELQHQCSGAQPTQNDFMEWAGIG